MAIDKIPTEQLEAELAKRRREKERANVPALIPKPDFKPVQAICAKYIAALAKEGYADDDFKHYIYEAAMECAYGKGVWSWVNSQHQ